ncbi:MAG TPA: MgtC/SapB family protein [Acidimicrobiales bacterium]|nr:MgtC/SapB family protein [Acidimicrobiales bacterium]
MPDPWHLSVPEVLLRLGLAAVFGGLVGAEREVKGRDAGIRTHLLLSLGAALFAVVSVGGFGDFQSHRNATNVTLDPTRVASYVAAGVGFLGGGAIIKGEDRIRGLTTAASLWVVAAIGLAAGLGLWSAAAIGSAIAIVALVANGPINRARRRAHLPDPSEEKPAGSG